jgi:nicotinate-nucleotide adenylyltransferase
MNIGLLGGLFNPVHIGHILVARQVLDFCGVDEVWLVPNFQPPLPKPTAPPQDRLAMLRCVEGEKLKISTLEIDEALDGKTMSLLPHLPKEHSYNFIIGSDQLTTFHLWFQWETLLKTIPFIVFPRYGYPTDPLYANMKVVGDADIVSTNISSTRIRDRVKRGLSICEFVPPGVSEYIAAHGLYK